MLYLTHDGFKDDDGNVSRQVHLQTDPVSAEWIAKQENSLKQYDQTHRRGKVDPIVSGLFSLFSHFIGTYASKMGGASAILDVGCGIYPESPPYIGTLASRFLYVGLDPILTDYDREYLFLNGKLEDAVRQVQASQFDILVFCTSLDHFEDLSEAAAAARYLLKDDGFAIFFVGLHDRELVSGQIGAQTYREIFSCLGLGYFLNRYARKAFYGLPRAYRLILQRERKLMCNEPLDDKHFHFFTQSSLKKELANNFGEIEEMIMPPNTNAAFVACRVRK